MVSSIFHSVYMSPTFATPVYLWLSTYCYALPIDSYLRVGQFSNYPHPSSLSLLLYFTCGFRQPKEIPPPPPPSYKLIHCLTDCSITFIPFPTTCSLASLVFSSLATTLSLCQYFYEGIIIYFVSLTPVQLSPLRIVI